MESFQSLAYGFSVALTPINLIFLVVGCFVGNLVGVLPGIGPTVGIAMLIPLTFTLPPAAAIIMLAAIYHGSMFGGAITSIMMNVPGDAANAITCIEGYPMAKKGRAGPALAMQAIANFFGGTVTLFGLVLVALPLARLALNFGPPELFGLALVGLSMVSGLTGDSIIKGLIAAVFGLLVAMVGTDPVMGAPRFTFGQTGLLDGVGLVPAVVGLFGVSEILINIENPTGSIFDTKVKDLWCTLQDFKDSIGPGLRGAVLGFLLGLIPGLAAFIASAISYSLEKRVSKHPEKFGTGVIEGIAGPEAANNAYVNGAMVPLFTLGIPASATMAVMMGAFMMNGMAPGPQLFTEHPDIVWGVIASMYLGNLINLVLNIPLIPIWLAILKIPYSVLFSVTLVFCIIGTYTLNGSEFQVGTMLAFSVVGYIFKKFGIPVAPVALTLVLEPLMEGWLRQSLEMSQGNFGIFFAEPISATLIVIAVLVVVVSGAGTFKKARKVEVAKVAKEEMA